MFSRWTNRHIDKVVCWEVGPEPWVLRSSVQRMYFLADCPCDLEGLESGRVGEIAHLYFEKERGRLPGFT